MKHINIKNVFHRIRPMRLWVILLVALWPMCMGYGQQPMDEETYDVILKLLKGEFNVPVASRTIVQRNAIIRFWRNRDQFSMDDNGPDCPL